MKTFLAALVGIALTAIVITYFATVLVIALTIIGFVLLWLTVAHILGTPITLKRNDVVIGEIRRFKYYPLNEIQTRLIKRKR